MGQESVGLTVTGSWFVDYRPTKLKITLSNLDTQTGTLPRVSLTDGEDYIANVNNYVSGADIELDWSAALDMLYLTVTAIAPVGQHFYVTDVYFY